MPPKTSSRTDRASEDGRSRRMATRSHQGDHPEVQNEETMEEGEIARDTPPHLPAGPSKGKQRQISSPRENPDDNRLDAMELRMDNMQSWFDTLDARTGNISAMLEQLLDRLDAKSVRSRPNSPPPNQRQQEVDYNSDDLRPSQEAQDPHEPIPDDISEHSRDVYDGSKELADVRDEIRSVSQSVRELAKAMQTISRHSSMIPAPAPVQTHAPNRISTSLSKEKALDINDPEAFSGTRPEKLLEFLSQLRIIFRAKPIAYSDDQDKIMYAISHCKGIAQKHFHNAIRRMEEEDETPVYMQSWPQFVQELKTYFGYQDEDREAEQELRMLRMKDSDPANKYIVEFTELAERVTWEHNALTSQFYEGLAWRIKSRMFKHPNGAPKTLAKLKTMAIKCDNMDKEEQRERNRSHHFSPPRTSETVKKPSSSSFRPSNPSKPLRPNTSHSYPKSTSATHGSSRAPPTSEVAKNLKPDGTLKESEKERRWREGLCTYCASPNHIVANCPKRTDRHQGQGAKPNTTGRAADAEEYSENTTDFSEPVSENSEEDKLEEEYDEDLETIDEDPDAEYMDQENFEAASDME